MSINNVSLFKSPKELCIQYESNQFGLEAELLPNGWSFDYEQHQDQELSNRKETIDSRGCARKIPC